MSYTPTKCSYCGAKATNQPIGDACHSCQKGTMRCEKARRP